VSEDGPRILKEALALPRAERAWIALALVASVDGEPEIDVEAAWAAEIEERARRVLARRSAGTDWETVRERIERCEPGTGAGP